MKMSRRKRLDSGGILRLLANRQIDERVNRQVCARLDVTESSILRLGLEKELEGHFGCVNCLEWNESGSILASASDDFHFNLWDPFRYRQLLRFDSGHRGNIFSVKFLPNSLDRIVVTGAGDSRVRVHDIEKLETTRTCLCPAGRVKRIATAPNLPYMFWFAAEDGFVMEVDLRVPHSCTSGTNNILINLGENLGREVEAKCLAINPCRPELLAVGANDPFIRLYDRRMIRPASVKYQTENPTCSDYQRQLYILGRWEGNLSDDCAQYFVAGHLISKPGNKVRRLRNLSTTYLTFSPSGTHLLANIGTEQIYLFDINNKMPAKKFDAMVTDTSNSSTDSSQQLSAPVGCSNDRYKHDTEECQQKMESLIFGANAFLDLHYYTSAIQIYNKAISIYPNCPRLYSKRAAAYMKRKWDGDTYAALRDYQLTLAHDPNHHMAHFRLAKCLFELSLLDEALQCLKNFKIKFPDVAFSHGYKKLMTEVLNSLQSRETTSTSKKQDGARERAKNLGTVEHVLSAACTEREKKWRSAAGDYEARFCGHCNTTTDIKEANFFGSDGQFIVAGSDDGSFFIWDRTTTNLVQVLRGDGSIVNCLQPHPTACLLATSGIDPVVRLWSPLPENGEINERVVENRDVAATENQRRMNRDPFEAMLMHMGYRNHAAEPAPDDEGDDAPPVMSVNCPNS